MTDSVTHRCECCGREGDAPTGELPRGWYVDIFSGVDLCDECMLSPVSDIDGLADAIGPAGTPC
jgi:hypothetical protein